MNRSDLFAYIKSDSIKNLIRSEEIKNKDDIARLQEKEYLIGFTYEELKKVLPERVAEKICFNNGFDKTFYYDREKCILFPVNMYGKSALKPFDELGIEIMSKAIAIENNIKQGDYFSSLLVLNDKMRMEMLNQLIMNDKLENPYLLFSSFYQTADYGCSELSLDTIKKLKSLKSEEENQKTQELLKDMPERITVYRGQGDKSGKWKDAVSWTTDINIANFFASRMSGRCAEIHIAEVVKSDIIEYFANEKECIILPEDIRYKDCIEIFGYDLLDEQLPVLSDKYKYYRDIMLDNLDFEIDDNEHGRLHSMRVLMNTLIIAHLKGLSEDEQDILCTAAIFHDSKRISNGEDEKHGMASGEYYRCFAKNHSGSITYREIVEQLIKYHCLPDETGKQEIVPEYQHLFDIFKDADALDRVRFGIRDLDLKQLRTREAKSMTMVANILLQNLKIPEQQLEQEMTSM